MYAAANLSKYGAVSVSTASPGRLLVMLYDALFRFLREGMSAMEAKDKGRGSERASRAHAILSELLTGLDRSISPSLCDHLEPLYAFCMTQALQAMIEQDPTKLAAILKVLTPLREAWSVAVSKTEAPVTSATATTSLRKAG